MPGGRGGELLFSLPVCIYKYYFNNKKKKETEKKSRGKEAALRPSLRTSQLEKGDGSAQNHG